jgi:glycosyltransferase involved in cell wall biosynthesis
MGDTLPSVSIVTPSFQQARFIDATIRSVLDQNYPRLEYLVVDGGSTDGTLEILRQYEPRLKWISEADKGQADAINKGFARTNGEIIAWLNSDDTYAPGAIQTVAEYFAAHPEVGVVYGNADFIDPSGAFIGACQNIEPFSRHRLLHYSDFLVQPAVFFRRELFQSVGGLDASLCWALDYDLWLKFAERNAQFAFLRRVLANYRWLDSSKTGAGGRKRIEEVRAVVQRHGSPSLPAYFRLEEVRLDLLEGLETLRQGRFGRALAKFGAAVGALVSPRVVVSLLSVRTWRIIWMGQVIRSRAGRKMG